MSEKPKPETSKEQKRVDEAVEETFPASDPVSLTRRSREDPPAPKPPPKKP